MKSTGANEVEALFSFSTTNGCWLYGEELGEGVGVLATES
jgi:hypothetical protein